MLKWETEPEPGQQATERGSAASSDIVTEVKRMKLRLRPTRGETQVKVMSEEGADWLRMMGDKSKTWRWTWISVFFSDEKQSRTFCERFGSWSDLWLVHTQRVSYRSPQTCSHVIAVGAKHVTLYTLLPHNNNTNLNALNLIIATNAHILPQDDSWRDGWFIRGGRDVIYCGCEMLNHTKACCRESSSLIPGWVNKSEQLPQACTRAFPLGAVQRMWKKPVKSPDVTTVFVSPFKEDSTLRCSYSVIYLHSVFCAFQDSFFFLSFFWLSEVI